MPAPGLEKRKRSRWIWIRKSSLNPLGSKKHPFLSRDVFFFPEPRRRFRFFYQRNELLSIIFVSLIKKSEVDVLLQEFFGNLETMEIILILVPLVVLELGLKILCFSIIGNRGVRNLTELWWVVIVLLVNTLGPIAFLLFGRKEH